jgi:hypothetical protein
VQPFRQRRLSAFVDELLTRLAPCFPKRWPSRRNFSRPPASPFRPGKRLGSVSELDLVRPQGGGEYPASGHSLPAYDGFVHKRNSVTSCQTGPKNFPLCGPVRFLPRIARP